MSGPDRPKRGIVIAFTRLSELSGIWVCAKLLAMHQCQIPIQIVTAANGKWLRVLKEVLSFLGNVSLLELPIASEKCDSWILVAEGILSSNADEILVLSPHTVPLRNPNYLFEHAQFAETGAILWPSFYCPVDRSSLCKKLNLPEKRRPEVESSQLLISRKRHEPSLKLALALAQNDEIVELLWGNRADSLQYALAQLEQPFAGAKTRPLPLFVVGVDRHMMLAGMCHFDLEGEQLFQNRKRYPWKLTGDRGIGGGIFEPQCLEFLSELRMRLTSLLNGQAIASTPEVSRHWLVDWNQKYRPPHSPDSNDTSPTGSHDEPIFDNWTKIELDLDGVVQTETEFDVCFWKLDRTGEGTAITLLDADAIPIASLSRVHSNAFLGRWTSTGRECRMIESGAILCREALAALYKSRKDDSPVLSIAETKDPRPRHLICRLNSISDAVATLFAACSLSNSGYDVILHTNQAEWFHRVSQPRLAITHEFAIDEDLVTPRRRSYLRPMIISTHANVGAYRVNGIGLAAAKCHALGVGLKPALPSSIDTQMRIRRLDFARYIIIVPFSDVPEREWPVAHWLRLATLLRRQGLDVVAVGDRDYSARASAAFFRSNVFWATGETTEWMVDTMLGAEAVIAANCGLAHIAALHRVRTLCLVADFTESYFFSELGLEIVAGCAPCVGCWRQPERGFLPSCRSSCSALLSISPEQVCDHFLHRNHSPSELS
jgi:Mannosyltransferase putative/Glycosyltransferase family 9 (heptosyltransferase)